MHVAVNIRPSCPSRRCNVLLTDALRGLMAGLYFHRDSSEQRCLFTVGTGRIPEALGDLRMLEELRLDSNRLTGKRRAVDVCCPTVRGTSAFLKKMCPTHPRVDRPVLEACSSDLLVVLSLVPLFFRVHTEGAGSSHRAEARCSPRQPTYRLDSGVVLEETRVTASRTCIFFPLFVVSCILLPSPAVQCTPYGPCLLLKRPNPGSSSSGARICSKTR